MMVFGHYTQGCNRAHQFSEVYRPAFGCPMVATFNVQLDSPITDAKPAKTMNLTWPDEEPKPVTFWLCQINGHWAWAMRWEGTRMPETHVEFISRHPLPERLKEEPLEIEVFERWSDEKIRDWGHKEYQWQGFPWLLNQRVDSEKVWKIIEPHADWVGASALDVGSHYGYHSFRASKLGAFVTAIEPNDRARAGGELIARHIEMQDVQFEKSIPVSSQNSDITLYLSVHHQWDPTYHHLTDKVRELLRHTRKVLFVEFILPPLFGKTYSPEAVDGMIGGQVLKTYQHRLRGNRRIYMVEGRAR